MENDPAAPNDDTKAIQEVPTPCEATPANSAAGGTGQLGIDDRIRALDIEIAWIAAALRVKTRERDELCTVRKLAAEFGVDLVPKGILSEQQAKDQLVRIAKAWPDETPDDDSSDV